VRQFESGELVNFFYYLSSGELSPLERSIPSLQLYRLVILLTPNPGNTFINKCVPFLKNEWYAISALQMQDGVLLFMLAAVCLRGCKTLK
jgi:hypothetical protein